VTAPTEAARGLPRGTIATGAGCVACSISLGCGGAFADGALAVVLGVLAAAIPVVWVFGPELVNGLARDRAGQVRHVAPGQAGPVQQVRHLTSVPPRAHLSLS